MDFHFVGKTWIIVGVVLGVVFALAVAGGVAWYLHKKRKCKKRDTKGKCFNIITTLLRQMYDIQAEQKHLSLP